ncbi:MAG: hypothetical protein KDD61_14900 [Bdellovibrionales bacterium]|nr:hypothetical protein [Bdellovibrionales bacterium]
MRKFFLVASLIGIFQLGCQGAESGHQPIVSEVPLEEPITFVNDILPLVQKRCSLCHNSGSGLPVWEDYQTLFDNREFVRFRVFENRSMPRGNATNMTEEERAFMAQWIDEGARFE